MPLTSLDRERLAEALRLAESSFGLTEPNPRVGCVIGSADGRVFGRGATQQAGGSHAEIMALRDARESGTEVRGATVWVTLEPCAHHGRTPPCCDALVAAGVARVVVAVADPFPKVAGAGIARLRAAGIAVEMADADMAAAARDVNIGFFSRIERGRPWVRLKVAASLDGRTALPNGASQWITGEEARRDGHAWRRRASAVLTGIGTVLSDDPRLDVRLVPTSRQPRRIVVDRHWRTPSSARMLHVPETLLIYGLSGNADGRRRLIELGAETVVVPQGIDGLVDLSAVMSDLARREANEVHVEAGARLNGSLLSQGLVDELIVYLAPRLLGDGFGMANQPVPARIADALLLHFSEFARVGEDLRIRCRTRLDGASPSATVSAHFTASTPRD